MFKSPDFEELAALMPIFVADRANIHTTPASVSPYQLLTRTTRAYGLLIYRDSCWLLSLVKLVCVMQGLIWPSVSGVLSLLWERNAKPLFRLIPPPNLADVQEETLTDKMGEYDYNSTHV